MGFERSRSRADGPFFPNLYPCPVPFTRGCVLRLQTRVPCPGEGRLSLCRAWELLMGAGMGQGLRVELPGCGARESRELGGNGAVPQLLPHSPLLPSPLQSLYLFY